MRCGSLPSQLTGRPGLGQSVYFGYINEQLGTIHYLATACYGEIKI